VSFTRVGVKVLEELSKREGVHGQRRVARLAAPIWARTFSSGLLGAEVLECEVRVRG